MIDNKIICFLKKQITAGDKKIDLVNMAGDIVKDLVSKVTKVADNRFVIQVIGWVHRSLYYII